VGGTRIPNRDRAQEVDAVLQHTSEKGRKKTSAEHARETGQKGVQPGKENKVDAESELGFNGPGERMAYGQEKVRRR